MTRSQSLETALLADFAISEMVGARIYPLVALPPNGSPTAIYQFEVNYDYTLSSRGIVLATLKILSSSADYDEAHALADAIQAVLMPASSAKGFSGLLGGVGGINVIGSRLQQETEQMVAITPDQFVFEVASIYELKYTL